MFSLLKAKRPAPRNTSRPSKTSGRRVSPNVSSPFSTVGALRRFHARLRGEIEKSSLRDNELIAQEYRAFGGDQFAHLHAVKNLPVAVALFADLDRPLGEMTAVGSNPCCHRAVAFPNHAIHRDRRRSHRSADADGEVREHAGAQFV